MDDRVREILKERVLLDKSLCNNFQKCRGILADLCPGANKEINVLIQAMKQGVVKEIGNVSKGIPIDILLNRLIKKLEDNIGLSTEASSWAVESWAIVLGKRSGASIYEKVCSKVPEKVEKVKPEQEDPTQIPSETEDTKECPYCAELIKKKAKKCKHCGEMLEGNQSKKLEEEKKREEDRRRLAEEKEKLYIERKRLEEEKKREEDRRRLVEEKEKLYIERKRLEEEKKREEERRKRLSEKPSVITVKGMELIKIPAGEFIMGSSDNDPDVNDNEKPQRKIYLDEYYIGKYPVTNGEYYKFILDGGYENPEYWAYEGWEWLLDTEITEPGCWRDSDYNALDQPVVGVTWYEADAFCRWFGGSLPTEAQWEKAARGTDGRKYPWGHTELDSTYANYADNVGNPTPVGKYEKGKSPYGCYDMAGNVWDWCEDWYDSDYYKNMPVRNPKNVTPRSLRVLRGGSWLFDARYLRGAYRSNVITPSFRECDAGFRLSKLP